MEPQGLASHVPSPGIANTSQKFSPPSPSTKPEARKDKIVVEVKSDKLSEEAGLLHGANGEKRPAADQVGQSDGHRPSRAGAQVMLRSPPPALPTLHGPPSSISSARGSRGREGRGQSRQVTKLCSVAVPAACPAWLCLLPQSRSQAPQGHLEVGIKIERSLATSQGRGCRNGCSEPEFLG